MTQIRQVWSSSLLNRGWSDSLAEFLSGQSSRQALATFATIPTVWNAGPGPRLGSASPIRHQFGHEARTGLLVARTSGKRLVLASEEDDYARDLPTSNLDPEKRVDDAIDWHAGSTATYGLGTDYPMLSTSWVCSVKTPVVACWSKSKCRIHERFFEYFSLRNLLRNPKGVAMSLAQRTYTIIQADGLYPVSTVTG